MRSLFRWLNQQLSRFNKTKSKKGLPSNVIFLDDYRKADNRDDEEKMQTGTTLTLTLNLSPKVQKRFRKLRELNGADSDMEIIRRALALYDVALTVTREEKREIWLMGKGPAERFSVH